MVTSPELKQPPEKTVSDWQKFSITREGEQRFGQLILGANLPNTFEINIAEVNRLTRQFFIQGDIAISRLRDNQKQPQQLTVSSLSPGAATATSALSIEDPDHDYQTEFDPDVVRHTIAIDFEMIIAKSRIAGVDGKMQAQAELIEQAVLAGLRTVAWKEASIISFLDKIQILAIAIFLLWSLLNIHQVTKDATPERMIDIVSSTIVSIIVYSFFVINRADYEFQFDNQDLNRSEFVKKYYLNNVIPASLVRNGARAITTVKTHLSAPHFIRPSS